MNIVNIILIFLLIFVIVFNIYYSVLKMNNYKENFAIQFLENYPDEHSLYDSIQQCNYSCVSTTNNLMKKDPSFLNTYSQYHSSFKRDNILNLSQDWKNYTDITTFKPLLAYRCLNVSPKKFVSLLSSTYPCFSKSVYIYNERTLNDFILIELQKMIQNFQCTSFNESMTDSTDIKNCTTNYVIDMGKNRGSNKIFGPVYVCISQAPYLNVRGEQVKARFDVVNNRRSFYTENINNGMIFTKIETDDGGDKSEFSSLYAEVSFVFPLYEAKYDNNAKLYKLGLSDNANRIDTFIKDVSSFVVNDELCHLKCSKIPNLSCGCLNATVDDMSSKPYIEKDIKGIRPYQSECLSPQNVKSDYSVMYFLNPYSDLNSVISNILR